MNYKIEKAKIEDIDNIFRLYIERMQWFKDNNIKQWTRYIQNHPIEEFIEVINNKEYYIVKNNEEIIGGFQFTNKLKEWENDCKKAIYISKIVTKVGYRNVGKVIFNKCKEMAREKGKCYLRLCCIKSNERLNEIYENHNFKLVGYGKNEIYTYALRQMDIEERG